MTKFDDYKADLEIAGYLPDKFGNDQIWMLTGYLLQLFPLAALQVERVREGMQEITTGEKNIERVVTMVTVIGDIRFYYEVLYWIALAIEKAGLGCIAADPKSAFGALFQTKLKPLTDNLKQGRIQLSHIHFDQLIKAEAMRDLSRIEKHLPDEKLLFSLTISKDGKGVKIAKTNLRYDEDYQVLEQVKTILAA